RLMPEQLSCGHRRHRKTTALPACGSAAEKQVWLGLCLMLKNRRAAAEQLDNGAHAYIIVVCQIFDGNRDVVVVQDTDVVQGNVHETSGDEHASGYEIEFGIIQFDGLDQGVLLHVATPLNQLLKMSALIQTERWYSFRYALNLDHKTLL